MEPNAEERLLDKLRAFIADELDDDERAVLGQLLAPGISQAYPEDDVQGFTVTGWSPTALPSALSEAVRRRGVRVVGLDN